MTRKIKLILLWTLVLSMAVTMIGCSEAKNEVVEKPELRIATLKGPTGMGMVELMKRNDLGEAELDYNVEVMGSPDALVGKVISGEVDVAAVPTNLALVLYNRTEGDVQLAAVNTLGVLYLLENGDTINSMADLAGKTVNISGKGATPDFIFRYLLQQQGLQVDQDVILDFKLEHSDLAAALVAGDVDTALLPQPHVTTALMRNEQLRIALDITEQWNEIMGEGSELPMGCIIVNREFAESNSEALNIFLEEYEQSTAFVNSEIGQAAELIEAYEILPNVAIAQKAIPLSNIVYIDAQAAKPFLEDYYQILYEFEPKSVGGKLADDGFYYKK